MTAPEARAISTLGQGSVGKIEPTHAKQACSIVKIYNVGTLSQSARRATGAQIGQPQGVGFGM